VELFPEGDRPNVWHADNTNEKRRIRTRDFLTMNYLSTSISGFIVMSKQGFSLYERLTDLSR
jgi:hypothetical protein